MVVKASRGGKRRAPIEVQKKEQSEVFNEFFMKMKSRRRKRDEGKLPEFIDCGN